MINEFKDKRILVTGGTGSIGSVIVKQLLKYEPKQIRIFSRDETKQFNLLHELDNDPRLRFLIGDIRDEKRIEKAMEDVDILFHAAAMKHVLACENDPFEAVKTNVLGTQNVIHSALTNRVSKVIGISTDKATVPVSVLGCTKLLSEKMMLASYYYKGNKPTKFCFVRFGNVINTRGSVVPLFYKQISKGGSVTVTDPDMTRFFMSTRQAVDLVLKSACAMQDREIFVLKMPVIKIIDLARAMIELYAPKFNLDPNAVKIICTGRKPGERIHEKLLTDEEAGYVLENKEMYVVIPTVGYDGSHKILEDIYGAAASKIGAYSSENQTCLSVEEIKKIIEQDEEYLSIAP